MAKYSLELKQKIVQAYMNGEGGYKYLAKKYKVTNDSTVHLWVKVYKELGLDGLLRSQKNKTFSFEFKLHVVELYLTTEVSYRDLALSMGINNPSLITRWVNDFRIAGPDALRPKSKGRRSKVPKPKKIKQMNIENVNIDPKYVKQLQDENLKLRIENAYLKEVRRLRLEETPRNKKRESSTASEDHSN